VPVRFKCTWIFSGNLKGWTETLYHQPTSGQFADTVAAVAVVNPFRAALLGKECEILAERVQQVQDAAGAKVLRTGDTFQNNPIVGNANEPAAAIDVCVEMDFLDSGKTRHKTLFLGGVWDSIESNFGVYQPTPVWNNTLDSWKNAVITQGFGWLGRVPSAPFAITSVTQNADGFVDIVTGGNPFPGGASNTPVNVTISGVKTQGGPSQINGSHPVLPTGLNACTTVKQIAILPYVAGGNLHTFTFNFIATAAINPEKIVYHKRGAPLLQSRGRARVRSKV